MNRFLALAAIATLAAPASAQTYAGLSIGYSPSGIGGIWLDARAERPVGPPIALGTPLRAGVRLGFITTGQDAALVPEVSVAAHPLPASSLDPYALVHAGVAIGSGGGSASTAGVEVGVGLRPAFLNGVGVSLFADLRRGGSVIGSTVSF